MKKFIIYMTSNFEFRCGGLVVQYELANILNNLGVDVSIISPNNITNSICNKFYNETPINIDNTFVIYGETIKGNPFNAKYVIRWILAPLGICSDEHIFKTWGKNDIIYYFNSETKFVNEPNKVNNIYKLLNIFYINPLAQNNNMGKRKGYCHTFRKSHYHKNLQLVHPPNSFEITREHTQLNCIKIFNDHKYFISYDPVTFMVVIASLCGCVSIIKKVNNMSKNEWLNITPFNEYIKETGINTLYGIAYGIEELEIAKNTLHLAKQQWTEIREFMINKNVKSFLKDMENYEYLVNNVQNNYY
jgi:hypothetical protein